MPAFGRDFAVVTGFVRNLRGGSQPILAQASDGLFYVLKFADNPQGPNLAFNESAGSELFSAYGLPVPAWKPLLLTDSFLDNNSACWVQTSAGWQRPASGLCFGSRFLGADGSRLLEVLPKNSYSRIRNPESFWLAWLLDVCADHADNRQAIFLEDEGGCLHAHFVDHGHLFGGPCADMRKNFRASRYLDSNIYPEVSIEALAGFLRAVASVDSDQLWLRVQALPSDWQRAKALPFWESCLQRLSTPMLLQDVLDTIIEDHARSCERELADPRASQQLLVQAPRPGVRRAGLGWHFADRPAFA